MSNEKKLDKTVVEKLMKPAEGTPAIWYTMDNLKKMFEISSSEEDRKKVWRLSQTVAELMYANFLEKDGEFLRWKI